MTPDDVAAIRADLATDWTARKLIPDWMVHCADLADALEAAWAERVALADEMILAIRDAGRATLRAERAEAALARVRALLAHAERNMSPTQLGLTTCYVDIRSTDIRAAIEGEQ